MILQVYLKKKAGSEWNVGMFMWTNAQKMGGVRFEREKDKRVTNIQKEKCK